ncbi:MAG: zinc-binding dehydrogenase, partial [Planctomycetaceae bacterium]
GWAEYIRVPAEWVIPMPAGMTAEESMRYGTAGFTAALSVARLREHEVFPESGEVVVTGATGGVGSIAVKMLAKLGYNVAAVTGKKDRHAWLRELGAKSIIERSEVDIVGGNPLLTARWTGAVDTVGGNTLATLLRTTKIGGCVTACGLVGGADLSLTVYPFILRGVALAGIDTAWYPRNKRLDIWKHIETDWRVPGLDAISKTIGLAEVDPHVREILAGRIAGRTVVRISE